MARSNERSEQEREARAAKEKRMVLNREWRIAFFAPCRKRPLLQSGGVAESTITRSRILVILFSISACAPAFGAYMHRLSGGPLDIVLFQ